MMRLRLYLEVLFKAHRRPETVDLDARAVKYRKLSEAVKTVICYSRLPANATE